MTDFNSQIIEQFRTGTDEHVGPFPRSRLVLLHTVGARSGVERVTPLMSFPDGDGGRYIVASKAGAPEHPAWFHNILAAPSVALELAGDAGVETVVMDAAVLDDAERDRVYAEIAAEAPAFGDYAERTARRIPVVRLSPR